MGYMLVQSDLRGSNSGLKVFKKGPRVPKTIQVGFKRVQDSQRQFKWAQRGSWGS